MTNAGRGSDGAASEPSVMGTLGCIPFSLGLLLVAFGGFYSLSEYRYWNLVLAWALIGGLPGIGVGLALMGTTNRGLASAGVLLCGASLALIMTWHFRIQPLWSDWLWGITLLNAFGVVYGISAIVVKTRRPTR